MVTKKAVCPRPRLLLWVRLAVVFVLAGAGSGAGSVDLAARLETLRSPGPIAATLTLHLQLEHTLHGKAVTAETSLQLDIDQDDSGLRVQWAPWLLKEADAEARDADRERGRPRPIREAMKELDPARLAHLLNQVPTISGIAKGVPLEEKEESHEGREAHRLVFRFEPRLSWTEQYYARRREGRLTIWVGLDGVPLASESRVSFEGKTSRIFGHFEGTNTIRTRYAVDGSRLRVADRDADQMTSHDDGREEERSHMQIVLTRR